MTGQTPACHHAPAPLRYGMAWPRLLTILALLIAVPIAPASDLLPDPDSLLRHRDDLGLTLPQITRLQEITDRGGAELRRHEERVAAAEQQLDAILQNVPLDTTAARAAGSRLLEHEKAMKRFILDILLEAHAVLDDDQRRMVIEHRRSGRQAADVYQRIQTLAGSIESHGGDISDLPARLRTLRDAAMSDTARLAAAQRLITELEQRLQEASHQQ